MRGIPILFLVLAAVGAYLLFGAAWFVAKWIAKILLFLFLFLFILSLLRKKS